MGPKLTTIGDLNYLGTEEQKFYKIFLFETNVEIKNDDNIWNELFNFILLPNPSVFESKLNMFFKNLSINIPPNNAKIQSFLKKILNLFSIINDSMKINENEQPIIIVQTFSNELELLTRMIYLLRHFIYATFLVNADHGFLVYLINKQLINDLVESIFLFFSIPIESLECCHLYNECLLLCLIISSRQSSDSTFYRLFLSQINIQLKLKCSKIIINLMNNAIDGPLNEKLIHKSGIVRKTLDGLWNVLGYSNYNNNIKLLESLSINCCKLLVILYRLCEKINFNHFIFTNKNDYFANFNANYVVNFIKKCEFYACNNNFILFIVLYELLLTGPHTIELFVKSSRIVFLTNLICLKLDHKTTLPIRNQYLLLINLLLFSQSKDLLFYLSKESINYNNTGSISIEMYRIGKIVNCSDYFITSLLILVRYNSLIDGDQYINTACLAILANISANFCDLHQETYNKITNLFEFLCNLLKKYNENMDKACMNTQCLRIISSLTILGDIMLSCLRVNPKSNLKLIYVLLLLKPSSLNIIRTIEQLKDVSSSLDLIVEYFTTKINTLNYDTDIYQPSEILRKIEISIEDFKKQWNPMNPLPKFNYFEESEANEFFSTFIREDISPAV